jgi:protein-disulfide isomerase
MPMLLLVLTAVAGCAATPSTDGPPKIIIYTDFQCGACGRLNSEVEPELISRYVATGQAQLEIRLLASVSPDSMWAAQAALCAGDQDRFLEYQDALFRAYRASGEDPETFSTDPLVALATSLGLDAVAFRSCLESGSKEAEVETNMDLAGADDVQTLPTVVVGSARVEGYRPLDFYVDVINVALEDN